MGALFNLARPRLESQLSPPTSPREGQQSPTSLLPPSVPSTPFFPPQPPPTTLITHPSCAFFAHGSSEEDTAPGHNTRISPLTWAARLPPLPSHHICGWPIELLEVEHKKLRSPPPNSNGIDLVGVLGGGQWLSRAQWRCNAGLCIGESAPRPVNNAHSLSPNAPVPTLTHTPKDTSL